MQYTCTGRVYLYRGGVHAVHLHSACVPARGPVPSAMPRVAPQLPCSCQSCGTNRACAHGCAHGLALAPSARAAAAVLLLSCLSHARQSVISFTYRSSAPWHLARWHAGPSGFARFWATIRSMYPALAGVAAWPSSLRANIRNCAASWCWRRRRRGSW